ncbi:MAG: MATE family efflux transporter [Clostridiales bacterium]|nr:MATE family efflux transporter [Clostridiales bacterium]
MVIVREKSFYKNMLVLALPIMLQNLISFGINFADNLMVGRLGENAIAGVYMGGQIQIFLTLLVLGVEGAVMVLGAQYWGRRDLKSIKDIIAIGVRVSLIFGVVFCAASFFFTSSILRLFTPDEAVITEGAAYLKIVSFSFLLFSVSQVLISSMRSVEIVSIGLYISVLSLILNIVLNTIFIFGYLGAPAMGAAGAALATLISRAAETACMLFYVLIADKRLRMKFSDFFHINDTLLRDFIHYGVPVIAGQAVWSINMLTQSAIIGRISSEAVAAVSVSNMLFNMVNIGMAGLSAAVSIITGKTVGAGEFDLMKLYAKTVQILFIGIGIISGFAIFISKAAFLSFYALEPATVILAEQFLNVLSVTVIGSSYQAACLAGLVKAGGDTGFVFKNDTIFVFLVVLPSAFIALFVLRAPAWVVFMCLKSDQILKCFVAVVKINSFNWMKNLTRDFSG